MPLKVEGISKRTKTAWLLRDISLEAAEGEILGICGPAGAGKATLLQILSGNEPPSSGHVLWEPTEISAPGRAVRLFGRRNADGFFARLRAAFQAPGSQRPLSDAAASNAKVVLLDHPFADLTIDMKQVEFERVRTLAKEEKRIVIVASEDFEDIVALCDKAVILIAGEIAQSGTPEQVYQQPASSAVARLTGRCNLIEARRLSSSKADVPEFQTIHGDHRLITQKTEKVRLGALNRNVRLGVRPEHVSIAFGASFPADNLLKAVVTEIRFLGPNTLVVLDAGGLKLQALVMRLVGLLPGDECMLGMPPDRIMVFPE